MSFRKQNTSTYCGTIVWRPGTSIGMFLGQINWVHPPSSSTSLQWLNQTSLWPFGNKVEVYSSKYPFSRCFGSIVFATPHLFQLNKLTDSYRVWKYSLLYIYYIISLSNIIFSIWIIFAAMSIQLKLSFDGAYQLVFMFIHKTLNILQGWYLQNSLRGVTSDMHEPNFVWLLLSQKTPGLTFLKEDTAILAHKNILNHTHQAWNTSILIAMHG